MTTYNKDLTVLSLLAKRARKSPEAIALNAPGCIPLNYGNLFEHIRSTVKILHEFGIERNDRVAVVLPNGADMAVAFLAVTSKATCAPLNPDYREKEFDFYLSDLKAKALIIQEGMDSPAIAIAHRKDISIIELASMEAAGLFSLKCRETNSGASCAFAKAEDKALMLHTSGTTSRPKMVPLTHANVCTSALNIRRSLKLTQSDCCLNVMPLFHIHGLVGAILSSVSAGASVVCTPGFYAVNFYEWLRMFKPTWYTAVPTMHQAILARAEENKDTISQSRLRFIRSCSSALAPQLMADLQKTFNVPVLEAYGMTEGSHQIASNPLPPRKQKAGSVGIATGTEIAIMGDDGRILPRGGRGEIVIRGSSVTSSYENNPEANSKSFTNGWFRTGDQGYFDEDDYLVITDRIKEIINRGGEKISPREVDEVLLRHPSVVQAVTFAMPHATLGEDVAAVIVLRPNCTATEWEIQQFVSSQLTEFKVPRRVRFVKEIPKGPTGKIQRIGLAERLGISSEPQEEPCARPEYEPPKTSVQEVLAKIWSRVIGLDRIGVDDNFFQIGGDSIQAKLIVSQLCEELHIEGVPLTLFLHAPTIRKMAGLLEMKDLNLPSASLTAIQPSGSRPPFFCVHACSGEILFLTSLAHHLGQEQPFYALRAQGLDENTQPYTRVEDMATHYLREILAIQPEGPYLLGGAGVGGVVAWEIAQRLMLQSKKVSLLSLVDSVVPKTSISKKRILEHYLQRLWFYAENREFFRIAKWFLDSQLRRRFKRKSRVDLVWELVEKAANEYRLQVYAGDVVILMSKKRPGFSNDPNARIDPWRPFVTGKLHTYVVPGEHLDVFKEPNVQVLAQNLRKYLNLASKR